MNDEKSFMLLSDAYIAAAALAGAITSLSLTKWQTMNRMEIVMALMVGFFFAIFVTPWLAHGILNVSVDNIRVVSAMTYGCAAGSNILLPLFIQKMAKMFGGDGGKDA